MLINFADIQLDLPSSLRDLTATIGSVDLIDLIVKLLGRRRDGFHWRMDRVSQEDGWGDITGIC